MLKTAKFDLVKKQTPLHVAVARNNLTAVQLLLKAGANVMMKDIDGDTPIKYAELKEDTPEFNKKIRSLLEAHSAEVSSSGRQKRSSEKSILFKV